MDTNQLIIQCKKGNRIAQKELYTTYKQKMFMLCMRYMGSNADANDALQEGFIKVFRDLHQFDAKKGKLSSWMARVFVNTNLELIRKRRMKIVDLDDFQHAYEGISPDVYHTLDQEDITKMIQGLPDGYRTIFNLYVVEGYSHKEIAEMLQISLSTSKSQLFKAKRTLKTMLDKVLLY